MRGEKEEDNKNKKQLRDNRRNSKQITKETKIDKIF